MTQETDNQNHTQAQAQETGTMTQNETDTQDKTQGTPPEIKEEQKDKKKTQDEKAAEKWERDLNTVTTAIRAIQTEAGVAWVPATGMTYFGIDLGNKIGLNVVRTANGGIPLSKHRGESIMITMEQAEMDRMSYGEIEAAPRVPRFWTAGEKNDLTAPSYIYRGGIDYKKNPPLYRIDSDGVQAVNNAGTGGAVFTYSRSMETIPAGIENGDIKDIQNLWRFMNLSPEYRIIALGAVLAPVVNSRMERPILFTTGPSETGKTTITERLSALVDPKPGGETSTRTNQGGDVIEQAALNTDTLIIGNISSVSLAASNALCQIGGGSTRKERELYANGSNMEYVIRATAMISTKEEHIRLEDDLQTRIIPIPTAPLTEEQRELFPTAEEWEEALPRLQAAALAIISAIKKDAEENPGITFNNPYRWKGVGEVIERTERVLRQAGITVVTPWQEALKQARGILSHRSSPVWVDFLIDDLTEGIAGSPGAVLKKMKEIAGNSAHDWYVSQQNFRRELEQHQEILEEAGVGVEIVKKVGGKKPRYEIIITPTAVNDMSDIIEETGLKRR